MEKLKKEVSKAFFSFIMIKERVREETSSYLLRENINY